jgi:hypothetical protein
VYLDTVSGPRCSERDETPVAAVAVETGGVIEMISRLHGISYVGCQTCQKTMVRLKGDINRK